MELFFHRARSTPNENKMSHHWRERAWQRDVRLKSWKAWAYAGQWLAYVSGGMHSSWWGSGLREWLWFTWFSGPLESSLVGHALWRALDGEETGRSRSLEPAPLSFDRLKRTPQKEAFTWL